LNAESKADEEDCAILVRALTDPTCGNRLAGEGVREIAIAGKPGPAG
jgi:hypothetical protein